MLLQRALSLLIAEFLQICSLSAVGEPCCNETNPGTETPLLSSRMQHGYEEMSLIWWVPRNPWCLLWNFCFNAPMWFTSSSHLECVLDLIVTWAKFCCMNCLTQKMLLYFLNLNWKLPLHIYALNCYMLQFQHVLDFDCNMSNIIGLVVCFILWL